MTKRGPESDNILVALHEHAAQLLSTAGIYPVLDFAWEGENTPAADYLGLAIWSTDAPFEPDWSAWNRPSPPPQMPTKRDETFYKAGEDFIGTMELARKAIGLALYSFEHRKADNIPDDDDYFWEYSAGAAVWLNIAADRIREYYVMARFGMTPKEYEDQGGRRNGFLRPFRAYDPNEIENSKQAATDLLKDAKQLDQRRNSRNKIVHEVASRQGKNALLSLKHQKEACTDAHASRNTANSQEGAETWKTATEAIRSERRKEMEDTIAHLKSWYLLSVHACALTFEYEYWKRIAE